MFVTLHLSEIMGQLFATNSLIHFQAILPFVRTARAEMWEGSAFYAEFKGGDDVIASCSLHTISSCSCRVQAPTLLIWSTLLFLLIFICYTDDLLFEFTRKERNKIVTPKKKKVKGEGLEIASNLHHHHHDHFLS